jgi:transposase
MIHPRLEGLGRSLDKEYEVVIEATANVVSLYRTSDRRPSACQGDAHARVNTDKIDAGVLVALRAADFLPEIGLPDVETERRRRLVARRNRVGPSSRADQKRGARDSACAPDPVMPALEDRTVIDRAIAQSVVDDPAVKRLLTITGVNLIVAASRVAAIGRRVASNLD